jgi:tripartite ATP-independent transporter DctP family solute receptor
MTGVIGRRNLVMGASVGAVATLAPKRSRAAQFNIKFATDAPSSDPVVVRMKDAADRIRGETNGRVDILVIPDGQLGDAAAILNQLVLNVVDMTLASSQLATTVPLAGVINLGFAFPDYSAVWQCFSGPFGALVRKDIETKIRNTVVYDDMLDAGFRQITTSTRPIHTPAELKGLKLRVAPTPTLTTMFEAFGAAPVPLPFTELYTALQTKLVVGEENSLSIINSGKLQEVQKYCTLASHAWSGFWLIINARTWHSFPPDVRDVIQENLKQYVQEERKDIIDLNTSLQSAFARQGMQFIEVVPGAFRAALARTDYYPRWKASFGPEAWQMLEDSVGKLG